MLERYQVRVRPMGKEMRNRIWGARTWPGPGCGAVAHLQLPATCPTPDLHLLVGGEFVRLRRVKRAAWGWGHSLDLGSQVLGTYRLLGTRTDILSADSCWQAEVS